jgi:hypothetical protein
MGWVTLEGEKTAMMEMITRKKQSANHELIFSNFTFCFNRFFTSPQMDPVFCWYSGQFQNQCLHSPVSNPQRYKILIWGKMTGIDHGHLRSSERRASRVRAGEALKTVVETQQ